MLVAGVCLAVLPRRIMNRHEAAGSEEACARRIEQAVLSRSRIQAHRRTWPCAGAWAIPAPTAVLWATLAATSITPAVLLRAWFASLPVGQGVVVLADQPESGRARASLLALLAMGLSSRSWVGLRLGIAAVANSTQWTWPDRQRTWNSVAFAGLDV